MSVHAGVEGTYLIGWERVTPQLYDTLICPSSTASSVSGVERASKADVGVGVGIDDAGLSHSPRISSQPVSISGRARSIAPLTICFNNDFIRLIVMWLLILVAKI